LDSKSHNGSTKGVGCDRTKQANGKVTHPKSKKKLKTKSEQKLAPQISGINGDDGKFKGNSYPPRAVPYKQRRLQKQRYTGGDALLNAPINRLADAFKAIVDAEGPISINSAKNRVVDAWSTRKGSRIDYYLDRAISYAKNSNLITVKGTFLWPAKLKDPPLRIHIPGEPIRPINDIDPEEIMMALIACVEGAIGISKDDLTREACKLFGLNATQDNAIQVEKIIDHMIKIKVFKNNEGKISKVKKC